MSEPTHESESAASPQRASRRASGGLKLTDATIAELRCPEGKKDALFFEETLNGFGIRVMPNRADGRPRKVFLVQYRVGDKVRREPPGDWGSELTLRLRRPGGIAP